MSSPSRNQKTLAPIATHWKNRSLSSVTSDAATFHSAHAHTSMELRPMSSNQDTQSARKKSSRPHSPPQNSLPSPKLDAIRMDRQDSGYAPGQLSASSSRRTSTSSSTRLKSPSKRNSTTRPSTKRASRSSPITAQAIRTSSSSQRPSLQTYHTTPPQRQIYQPSQFYQFPTLRDPEESLEPTTPLPPAPPATFQYWTSDSTRRLEYAAIDAASRGVKGFFIKLVPDCILPPSSRRTKFHCDDEASDAGSVRRYRLTLPEEKDVCERLCERSSRPSGFRRWASTWRRGAP